MQIDRCLKFLQLTLLKRPQKISICLSNVTGCFLQKTSLLIYSNNLIWKYDMVKKNLSIHDTFKREVIDIIALFKLGKFQVFLNNEYLYIRGDNVVKVICNDIDIKELEFPTNSKTILFSDPCLNIYNAYNAYNLTSSIIAVSCKDLKNSENWTSHVYISQAIKSLFVLTNNRILLLIYSQFISSLLH